MGKPNLPYAKLRKIYRITSKNGRNGTKWLDSNAVMVPDDDKPKKQETQRKADLRRNESENESGNSEDAQTASHTITKEELKSIFIFDTNQTVTVVLADLEQFNGEKHINGKSIFIDKIIVQQQDTQSGTFTLLVTGNVNGQKDFEETLDFAGFANHRKKEKLNIYYFKRP